MYEIIFLAVFAYLVGGIPNGLIIGKKFYGVDLRNYGSKNIGTSNAFRTLGKKPAFFVFVADLLKGIIGVWLGMYFYPTVPLVQVLGGIMAMVGHNWPVYLNFKGGKGVATGLGVLLMLSPKVTALVFLVWLAVIMTTRFASLASMLAAIVAPLLMWYWHEPQEIFAFGILAAIFVVIRHKTNIVRLMKGAEPKIKAGKIDKG